MRQLIITALIISGIIFLQSCETTDSEYPNSDLLVSVNELMGFIDYPDVVIVDMREEGYEEGHIPNSVNLQGAASLHDDQHEIDAYLVGSERFAEIMSEKGISNDSRVIIYDEGNSLQAARLFYALDVYGHDNKQILNGGIAAWQNAGLELSTEATEVATADFQVNDRSDQTMCDISYIQERLNDEDFVVFDARTEEEFTGEEERTRFSGHIPGAVHLEWSNAIREDDEVPYFKSANELEQMLTEKGITPDKEVVPHCHTNVRGSHAYFTLRLMGYDSVRAYEGSWTEYGETEGLPLN